MTKAKNGDTVKVHYTGRLTDGAVFDSSAGQEPLEFTLGQRQVIAGFESAVLGMDLGEEKTTEIPVDQAYGPRDERLILTVPRNKIPGNIPLELNTQLQLRRPDGGALVVTITGLAESNVIMDGNHPLAGQDLIFDLQLVEIV